MMWVRLGIFLPFLDGETDSERGQDSSETTLCGWQSVTGRWPILPEALRSDELCSAPCLSDRSGLLTLPSGSPALTLFC